MGIVCAEKTEASCWTGSFHSHMVQDVDCTGLTNYCQGLRSARSSSIHGVFAQCLLAFSQTLQVSEIKISFRVLKSQCFL